MNLLLAWTPSGPDLIILLVLGVLLFGRRLPEIGRYLGKGIVEFKKGLKGMEDEVESGASLSSPAPRQEAIMEQPKPPQRVTAAAPKFEDPTPKFEAVAPKAEDKPVNPPPPVSE